MMDEILLVMTEREERAMDATWAGERETLSSLRERVLTCWKFFLKVSLSTA